MPYRIKVRGERHRVTAIRLLALASAVIWLAFAIRAIGQAATPLTWPTVTGRITESHVQQVFVATYVGRYQNSPVYEWRFFVKYQYVVAGETYVGTRIDANTEPGRKYPLTGERRYPVGSAVLVHYRPENATDAVLELPIPWTWIVSLIGAAALGWLSLSSRKSYGPQNASELLLV